MQLYIDLLPSSKLNITQWYRTLFIISVSMWLQLSPISTPTGILSNHLELLYMQWLCLFRARLCT